MPRKKLYQNNAERQRQYRLRNDIKDTRKRPSTIHRLLKWKETNISKSNSQNQKRLQTEYRKRLKMKIPFIAFDGEGITTNEIATYSKEKPVYKQLYTLFSASDGQYIENWKDGLSTKECLNFLLRYTGKNFCIGFGIGYDVTKILTDLDKETLECLWELGECMYENYYIKYIPNKIFVVSKDNERITLYDTFGFFQKSFIKALTDWNIEPPKEIIKGKEKRAVFDLKDKSEIRKYNLIECKLLVEMMDRVRQAMFDANFLPNQWYGAGAIARDMFEQNGIKYYVDSPRLMIPKFLNAYYGGRNQVLKMGEFDSVYLHDINSAYPFAMSTLPSSIGEWFQAKPILYDYPWCLYEVKWNLPDNTLVTPFPVRKKTSIYWPKKGSGWYWQPEVWQAAIAYPEYIKITDCYYYTPENSDHFPFKFLLKYYEKRKEFIAQGSDAQQILKLGINACYGLVAQSIGKRGERPAFQNWFWAGYITSQTRSQVFALAIKNPKSIIGFSTDGVVSQDQLFIHSQEKRLGSWDVKHVENYFILQSGVYTYKDNLETKFKSRGFSHHNVDYDRLREIWRESGMLGTYKYVENRFVGIGNGIRQNLNLIGNWYEQERTINFVPTSMEYGKWSKKFRWIQLIPPTFEGSSESYKMKVNWLDHPADLEEMENDLQLGAE